MGYYINQNSKGDSLPVKGKLEALKNDGAIITDASFKENLVCVVETVLFDAAAYMFSEDELDYFVNDAYNRKSTFLVYPNAKELAK